MNRIEHANEEGAERGEATQAVFIIVAAPKLWPQNMQDSREETLR